MKTLPVKQFLGCFNNSWKVHDAFFAFMEKEGAPIKSYRQEICIFLSEKFVNLLNDSYQIAKKGVDINFFGVVLSKNDTSEIFNAEWLLAE
jgi:hypothetical protein